MPESAPTLADAQAALACLGSPAAGRQEWIDRWSESQPSYRPGELRIFAPATVAEACRAIGFSPEVTSAVVEALPHLQARPEWLRLAWHCHWLLFASGQSSGSAGVQSWPDLSPLGPAGRMFYVLVFLSGLPHVRQLYRRRGIGEDILADTLGDLELWIRWYRDRYGEWGFNEIPWPPSYFTGELYRLGRLQFQITRQHSRFRVFEHVAYGRVVALADAGMTFRTDGQFDGANGIYDPAAWQATFEQNDEAIIGQPVSPHGRALRRTVSLPAGQWRPRLAHGLPVLNIHIPAIGPMDHAACGESFRQALEFFPRHFPEHEFRAFVCQAWLLDPQFEQYLPVRSNIVAFLREFYLYPAPGASNGPTLRRVFGWGEVDLAAVPRDTSLQRTVAEHIEAGGAWRNTGGFILADQLEWGGQVYRTRRRFTD